MPTTLRAEPSSLRCRSRCGPGRDVPDRHAADLHPAATGCRRQVVPHGLARRGESHPCLSRPRQGRHVDQGRGRPRLAAGDGPGRHRRCGGAAARRSRHQSEGRHGFHRRAGGRPAARPGPIPRAGRPPRRRAQRRPVQPSRSRQGRHGHQGRAGRGRHVAPPLRPGRRRADRHQ